MKLGSIYYLKISYRLQCAGSIVCLITIVLAAYELIRYSVFREFVYIPLLLFGVIMLFLSDYTYEKHQKY